MRELDNSHYDVYPQKNSLINYSNYNFAKSRFLNNKQNTLNKQKYRNNIKIIIHKILL